jgi:UDP-glucose 4-epimerase
MKNVIITGTTSFVGVAVTELLLHNNVNVYAVVRPNSLHLNRLPIHPKLSVIELDIADISMLINMSLPHFEAFYHFAWDGVRLPAREDETLQTLNYTYAVNAIQTAHGLGCEVFIGTGSQAEYGFTESLVDENCSTNPTTPYGKSKLDVCNFGLNYSKNHGIRFIWSRIFSLYGIHDSDNTLIMSCLKKMRKDEEVELSSCNQMWDYLHVSDAAQALYLLGISSKANGIYNIASGISKPLMDFVEEMRQITNTKSKINFGEINNRGEECDGFEPVVNRLKREFNWSPQIKFRDGISEILDHMER